MLKIIFISVMILMTLTTSALAKIVDFSTTGFTIEHEVELETDSKKSFQKLVKISDWWDSSHTFSGNAQNLSLELKAGGCWCEKLSDGGFAKHAEVIRSIPDSSLILVGALGPLQDLGFHGNLGFYLIPSASNKTLLKLRYTVLGNAPANTDKLAQAVDRTLLFQLQRLKNTIN